MASSLPRTLAAALEHSLGEVLQSARPMAGGDIAQAWQVELASGERLFVKSRAGAEHRFFEVEALGLEWLRAASSSLRVPTLRAQGRGEEPAFLALEYLEPAAPTPSHEERLGRGLAELHRASLPSFGLDYDNFIGSLPQRNGSFERWVDFYRERRLLPLIRDLHGHFDEATQQAFEELLGSLEAFVGPAEAPARLHGDLWAGNALCTEGSRPALIDPAVYAGHREVDLAMMRLFGGFGPRVFAAYEEAFPLAPGHEGRVALYQLYPLLVHVRLFGEAYLGQLQRTLRLARGS